MMELYRVWILIGKKINNEASVDEMDELRLLLSQENNQSIPAKLIEQVLKDDEPDSKDLIDELKDKNWKLIEQFISNEVIELKEDDSKKNSDIKQNRPRIFKWIYAATIAASIIIIAAIGIFHSKRSFTEEDKSVNQVSAPTGGVSKVSLPDGSKVWLNAGSKIIYKNNFGRTLREVGLTGEAYFEVVKDALHPFIVTTQTIQIKVLGTKFNVRSYLNDKTTEASLLQGKIELTLNRMPDHKYILRPSDKISIINSAITNQPDSVTLKNESNILTLTRIHKISKDSIPIETEWIENKIAFHSEDFETLARQLERHYDVNINLCGNKIKFWRFSGTFQHESIKEALFALQTAHHFKYDIKQNTINIYEP